MPQVKKKRLVITIVVKMEASDFQCSAIDEALDLMRGYAEVEVTDLAVEEYVKKEA